VFRPEKLELDEPEVERLEVVRRALVNSAGVVFVAVLLGWLIGSLLGDIFGCTTKGITNGLQIVGAGVLLWGTLFVRGWEIQSFGGFPLAALLSIFAQYFGRNVPRGSSREYALAALSLTP
jgi:hypothetical protein